MRLVVDVCMPPALAEGLRGEGHEAQHWSALGDSGALDAEILGYCEARRAVVITHDLDFGDLLAASGAALPSVIIVREQSTDPSDILALVLDTLHQFAAELEQGCLISVNHALARLRPLPII